MSGGITGSSTKSKSNFSNTMNLDPRLESTLYGNVDQAQQFAQTPYQQLSPGQIQQYQDPFQQQVIDATAGDLERSRQTAQIDNDAAATKAGAFGGSRHGVLGALTNSEYDRNTGGILGSLRSQGYGQALQTAQGENQNANNWRLQLQQLLQGAIGQLPTYGTESGASRSKGSSMGFSASYGAK